MFDHTYLLNMDRRPSRLEQFYEGFETAGWPYRKPERFQAVDGSMVPPPTWFTQQPGAWGCLQSHMRMWVEALVNDWDAIAIFEDDCIFIEDFGERIGPFMEAVPDDWDMIYFGGLARRVSNDKPERMNELVWRLYGITGTWAMALSKRILPKLYRWFVDMPRERIHHVDRMLCQFHIMEKPKVYAPYPWLCGMASGQSDICTRNYQFNNWWEWDPNSEEPPQYLTQYHMGRVHFDGERQIGPGTFGGIQHIAKMPASL